MEQVTTGQRDQVTSYNNVTHQITIQVRIKVMEQVIYQVAQVRILSE